MERLLRSVLRLIRFLGISNLLALFLLTVAAASLVYGVGEALGTVETTPLILIALAGVLPAWFLAGLRLRGWIAGILFSALGLLLVVLTVGRMAKPLSELIAAAIDWLIKAQQARPLTLTNLASLDHTLLEHSWQGLGVAGGVLSRRVLAWLPVLWGRKTVYDPLVAVFVWSILVWGTIGWAAWWTRRHLKPLAGLLPAGVIIAINLAYSGISADSLVAWLGCAVALQAWATYICQVQFWTDHHFDIAEIHVEWAVGVGVIAVVLIVFSMIVPSLSVQQVAERIQSAFSDQQQAQKELAESLGLQQRPQATSSPIELAANPGMPNQSLLGSGPELSQQQVMTVSVAGFTPLPQELVSLRPDLSPPTLYWRGLTFDRYTGKGWAVSPYRLQGFPAGQSMADHMVDYPAAPYDRLQQTVQIEREAGGLLYAAGEVIDVSQPYQAAWRAPDDLFGVQVGTPSYTVESRVLHPTAQELRAAGEDGLGPPALSDPTNQSAPAYMGAFPGPHRQPIYPIRPGCCHRALPAYVSLYPRRPGCPGEPRPG
jgi:type II secretory pathway pseudopilin PulG